MAVSMSAWTNLNMAKKQVGIPLSDCANDDLLARFLEQAEAMVLNYVSNDGAVAEPTAPNARISGAIYLQFAELWRFRGDDVDGEVPESAIRGALSPQVERCILSLRPPSLA